MKKIFGEVVLGIPSVLKLAPSFFSRVYVLKMLIFEWKTYGSVVSAGFRVFPENLLTYSFLNLVRYCFHMFRTPSPTIFLL